MCLSVTYYHTVVIKHIEHMGCIIIILFSFTAQGQRFNHTCHRLEVMLGTSVHLFTDSSLLYNQYG